jgi:hypothetical protein
MMPLFFSRFAFFRHCRRYADGSAISPIFFILRFRHATLITRRRIFILIA